MTSVPAKDILQSAIVVGDWLLSCKKDAGVASDTSPGQKTRRKDRYDQIFSHLYEAFRESRADEEAYLLFVDALEDVFDILAEGQTEGHVKAWMSSSDGGGERKIEKGFPELLSNAHDYLMFLLVFAKHLDARSESDSETHLSNVIAALVDLKPPVRDNKPIDFPELRLKAIMSGFNFLAPTSVLRYAACLKIVQFAADHDLFDKLVPYIHSMDEWVFKSGQSVSAQRRKLYTMIADQLRRLPKMEKDLLVFAMKIVKEFDTEALTTTDLPPGAAEAAVELLALAISMVDVVTFDDIMESRTVQKLKGTQHERLLELGTIFYKGDHRDFNTFYAAHPDVFVTYKLDPKKCLEKIQLLVLASMTEQTTTPHVAQGHQQLPLRDVSERLQLPPQEAESLAVRAIGLGIIDGRIDQMNGVIAVQTFRQPQWQQLKQRLTVLNGNITEILNELEKHAVH